jgi:CBS-domain-containing membrane protein
MKAKNVMTKNVVTVNPDTPVHEIARLLLERHISAVPVVDKQHHVIGIVSEGDLMRRPETQTERRASWWLGLLADADSLAREYVKSHGRDAQSVMTRNVVTVTEDTELADIAQLLEKKRIKRVPVVHAGRLVGLISRANLIQGLAVSKQPLTMETKVDDQRIRESIFEQLNKEPWGPTSMVNAFVEHGVVHLYGFVDSAGQREAVEIVAKNTAGVRGVENHLHLRRELPAGA